MQNLSTRMFIMTFENQNTPFTIISIAAPVGHTCFQCGSLICFFSLLGHGPCHLPDIDGYDDRQVPGNRVSHPVHELEEHQGIDFCLSWRLEW